MSIQLLNFSYFTDTDSIWNLLLEKTKGKVKKDLHIDLFWQKTAYINAIYNTYGHLFYKLVTGVIHKD